MSVQSLSNSAELYLHAMHLRQEDEVLVRECISKYSLPKTFCDAVNWVVYRLVNAFKRVFGKSDWQITEEIVQNHAHAIAAERGLFQGDHRNLEREVIDVSADGLLSNCWVANSLNAEVNAELRETLNALDLEHVIEDLRVARGSL